MTTRYPPDSHAPAVIVLTRFFMVTLILGTLARLATKWWKFRTFFQDDYYALLAMIFSIGQAIAISITVSNGYGSPIAQLSDDQIADLLKAQYAATLLYIIGIGFSQLSLLRFLQYIASQSQRAFGILQIAVIVVSVVGVLGSAFQCRPRQWEYLHDRCFDREAWFTYLATSMIVVEIAIIAQAVVMMVRVQTSWERKFNLLAVFLFRVVVPATLLALIILLHQTTNSADPTSSTWPATICTQLALCLSVVTASTPQFVPVLRQLQSSGMRLDGISRYTLSSSNNTHSHSHSHSYSRGSRSKYILSGGRSANRNEEVGHEIEMESVPFAGTKTTVTGGLARSSSSNGEIDEGILSCPSGEIRETRTFIVTGERVGADRR